MPDFNEGLEKYEDFCARCDERTLVNAFLAASYIRKLLEIVRREREAAWEASMGEDL